MTFLGAPCPAIKVDKDVPFQRHTAAVFPKYQSLYSHCISQAKARCEFVTFWLKPVRQFEFCRPLQMCCTGKDGTIAETQSPLDFQLPYPSCRPSVMGRNVIATTASRRAGRA